MWVAASVSVAPRALRIHCDDLKFGQHPQKDTFDKCNTVLYDRVVRKKLIAVRLKPDQVEKLERISLREDVPVSWLIRKAIDEFLKRKK